MTVHLRKSHFLGTKLRGLRKGNGLTLEELSARCIQLDARAAPSVSYLSMIESGKRVPSDELLALLGRVFQREPRWFLDGPPEAAAPAAAPAGGAPSAVPLEPAFLFSRELLQAAIPELLAQTGTTGRQFAHLLIRSHQEMSHNDFPDLERAAERVGERRFPLGVDDLLRLCRSHGLQLRWFERKPVLARDKDRELRSMVRSFYEAPRTLYLNRALEADPARLKFDLASHLGHKVLHDGDGLKSPHATGGEMGGSPEGGRGTGRIAAMSAQDVLHAWRDFECSFFAGALLAPKAPFRRFLMRESYRVEAGEKIELTPAVVMRRMTKVSPYPHWHFFDAYPPGYLRAVYRGNGIPLPWGNMAQVTDPCPNWAVFRMLQEPRSAQRGSQISVLVNGEQSFLYCCHSRRTNDMAGNPHVLSVGVDLAPALRSHGIDAEAAIAAIRDAALAQHGEARIPDRAAEAIRAAARVLDIAWVEDAVAAPARIICPRSTHCPRSGHCDGGAASRAREIADVREEILRQSGFSRRK